MSIPIVWRCIPRPPAGFMVVIPGSALPPNSNGSCIAFQLSETTSAVPELLPFVRDIVANIPATSALGIKLAAAHSEIVPHSTLPPNTYSSTHVDPPMPSHYAVAFHNGVGRRPRMGSGASNIGRSSRGGFWGFLKRIGRGIRAIATHPITTGALNMLMPGIGSQVRNAAETASNVVSSARGFGRAVLSGDLRGALKRGRDIYGHVFSGIAHHKRHRTEAARHTRRHPVPPSDSSGPTVEELPPTSTAVVPYGRGGIRGSGIHHGPVTGP